MKNIFFIVSLFIVNHSFAQKLTCKDGLLLKIHYQCALNEKINDDPYNEFTPISSQYLNEVVGTNYPINEKIYGCGYMKNNFGYSFIFQRINESDKSIKIVLAVTDKFINLIAEETLGEKSNLNISDNNRLYYFTYKNDTTIAVNHQIWDYTYNNLVEDSNTKMIFSKDGIIKIDENSY